MNDKEKLIVSYINNKTDRNLLYALLKQRGATNWELSTEFQMKKSSTYRYLKKYVENCIVEFRIEGRHKRYYLNQEYETLLIEYMDKSVVKCDTILCSRLAKVHAHPDEAIKKDEVRHEA